MKHLSSSSGHHGVVATDCGGRSRENQHSNNSYRRNWWRRRPSIRRVCDLRTTDITWDLFVPLKWLHWHLFGCFAGSSRNGWPAGNWCAFGLGNGNEVWRPRSWIQSISRNLNALEVLMSPSLSRNGMSRTYACRSFLLIFFVSHTSTNYIETFLILESFVPVYVSSDTVVLVPPPKCVAFR